MNFKRSIFLDVSTIMTACLLITICSLVLREKEAILLNFQFFSSKHQNNSTIVYAKNRFISFQKMNKDKLNGHTEFLLVLSVNFFFISSFIGY